MTQRSATSVRSGAAHPRAERVPLRIVLAYGPPIFGLSALLFFVQFFFLKFATDVLLLAPATVGVIFALGRAWDAVSDPIAGTWSDRTRTRLGRRRPWMLAAIPVLGLTFAMIWIPPAALHGTALTVWIGVGLFAFYTAFTAYVIPHLSLGAELSTDHHDRSRIFGARHAAFTLGIMLAFGGMQFVENSPDPRAAAASLALVAIVVLSAVLLIPASLIAERAEYQGRGAQSSFGAMGDVLRNPHARILLFVVFIEMSGSGVLGILSPYLTVYILKRPDLIGPLPAIFVVFSVISIPFWVRASRRFGKRNVWRFAMVGTALSFGSCFFVGEGDVVLICVLLVFAGLSSGCGGAVGPSMLADVIDYDEYVSGERKEGAYSAAQGFAIKAAHALIILLTGVLLQVSGFEPNVEQGRAAELAIRGLFAGAPFAMFSLAAVVFGRFLLDHREHGRIRAELDARRAVP
ncbi:MAG: MFS transporter [Deltaproteobacteria bacterium]|nr:MAG: MFS transporter [Deltaproteobacteria bacterium]